MKTPNDIFFFTKPGHFLQSSSAFRTIPLLSLGFLLLRKRVLTLQPYGGKPEYAVKVHFGSWLIVNHDPHWMLLISIKRNHSYCSMLLLTLLFFTIDSKKWRISNSQTIKYLNKTQINALKFFRIIKKHYIQNTDTLKNLMQYKIWCKYIV